MMDIEVYDSDLLNLLSILTESVRGCERNIINETETI